MDLLWWDSWCTNYFASDHLLYWIITVTSYYSLKEMVRCGYNYASHNNGEWILKVNRVAIFYATKLHLKLVIFCLLCINDLKSPVLNLWRHTWIKDCYQFIQIDFCAICIVLILSCLFIHRAFWVSVFYHDIVIGCLSTDEAVL